MRTPRCRPSGSGVAEFVRRRTQIVNRLHVLLSHSLDGGAPASLTADYVAALLGRIRRTRTTRWALAADLVAEIRHLDKKIFAAEQRQSDALSDSELTLL
ncbi:hypothetical protein [Amycolatopsis magusensis]|uniref:hypothetical protein n=1 Tax=Amycolatopsis magusensis TaxID=882444 RepID=UPI0024A8139E|nr:hypothetical protein [Amycolatopsis magusensis]MDI5979834.1 hypothetical protein [Amycolatopsis magusensis]